MNKRNTHSDLELLSDFAATGSDAAFTDLTKRHYDFVFGVAWRKTSRQDWAEDVAQEVFILLAHKGRAAPQIGSNLANWLHHATINITAHRIRKEYRYERRNRRFLAKEALRKQTEPAPTQAFETDDILDRALQALNAADRSAILLRYYEGKTYEEIGDVLGKGAEACRKQCTRALARMASWLRSRGHQSTTAGLGIALAGLTVKRAKASVIDQVSFHAVAQSPIAWGTARAFSLSFAQLAALLVGVVLPFAVMWPSLAARLPSHLLPVKQKAIGTTSLVPTSRLSGIPISSQLNLEWLAEELRKWNDLFFSPRQAKLQVLVQALDETQIHKLAEISQREGHASNSWNVTLMRWGELDPQAALSFIRFEETIKQLSLQQVRQGAARFAVKVRAIIKGWAASDPDSMVKWALNGGEKHLHYVRLDDALILVSPRHGILLGEMLGNEKGNELQTEALAIWAKRQPEDVLQWIQGHYPKDTVLERIHQTGKQVANDPEVAMHFANWLEPIEHSKAVGVVASMVRQRSFLPPTQALESLSMFSDIYTTKEVLREVVEQEYALSERYRGRRFPKGTVRCWYQVAPSEAKDWVHDKWSSNIEEFLEKSSNE